MIPNGFLVFDSPYSASFAINSTEDDFTHVIEPPSPSVICATAPTQRCHRSVNFCSISSMHLSSNYFLQLPHIVCIHMYFLARFPFASVLTKLWLTLRQGMEYFCGIVKVNEWFSGLLSCFWRRVSDTGIRFNGEYDEFEFKMSLSVASLLIINWHEVETLHF